MGGLSVTLPAHIVDEIMTRLGEEESQRSIAAEVGVSRGTVQALASGRRSPTLCRRPKPADLGGPDRGARPVRHTCGYLVYLPCQICQARQEREKARREREKAVSSGQRAAGSRQPADDLALDLPRDADTQRRYREARASAQARQFVGAARKTSTGQIAEHPHVDPEVADHLYAALAHDGDRE